MIGSKDGATEARGSDRGQCRGGEGCAPWQAVVPWSCPGRARDPPPGPAPAGRALPMGAEPCATVLPHLLCPMGAESGGCK